MTFDKQELLGDPEGGLSVTETYVCPVCGFPNLETPPTDSDGHGNYDYCPSCGFQFGVTDDDRGFSYQAWRKRWIDMGMRWDFDGIMAAPDDWNAGQQLDSLLRGGSTSAE